MKNPSYTYSAHITNVVDGDTIDATVDLGFTVSVLIRFRLNGVDTPETNSSDSIVREAGNKAKTYTKNCLLDKQVTLVSHKTDKYGRWLCDVYLSDGQLFNDSLISEGYAVPYFGGKK